MLVCNNIDVLLLGVRLQQFWLHHWKFETDLGIVRVNRSENETENGKWNSLHPSGFQLQKLVKFGDIIRIPKNTIKQLLTTGWSIWECPNLNHYCRIFHLVSMYLFWVLLISLVRTFWFLKSDFWYSKIHFLAQNGDISKGYPLEILKIIISNLKNHSRYQNVHTNHE